MNYVNNKYKFEILQGRCGAVTVNKWSRYMLILLSVCTLLSGCAESNGKYKTISTLSNEEFVYGFRKDDRTREIINAALKVLAANGKLAEISSKWFRENIVIIAPDANALEPLENYITERVFIVGFDEGAVPLSFQDENGSWTGFDIEVVEAICSLLGWRLRLININPSNVLIELSSGNIDCAVGGMSFLSSEQENIDITEAYIKSKKVLVALSGFGTSSKGALKGKEIGMTYDPLSLETLNQDATLSKKIHSYIQYKTTKDCFAALESGECNAVIVDDLAVDYYAFRELK